jgi:hypothetical protein
VSAVAVTTAAAAAAAATAVIAITIISRALGDNGKELGQWI